MIFGLFKRRRENPAVERLHEAVVKQSRQPVFYLDYEAADTVDGRYDLLVLHTFLVVRQLSSGGATEQAIAQEFCDLTFLHLDRSLREMGVGDMSIPKRMKKLAQKFYGRVDVYDRGLASGDDVSLAEALDRNVYRGEGAAKQNSLRLARYVRASVEKLAAQDLTTEEPRFADAAAITAVDNEAQPS